MLGKVKWYDKGRGIGVIEGQDGNTVSFDRYTLQVYAGHLSTSNGQEVEFEVVKGSNGQEAKNLHILS